MNEAARSMTRPRGVYGGWMQALHWSRCAQCHHVIDQGDWQGLAAVPDHGPRWVHEACALALGPLGAAQRPEHDRGVAPDRDHGTSTDCEASAVLRVLVVGSPNWPRERATEVRDSIAAVVRGHRHARIAHAARTDPDTGRLAGVDAWAELTATRLGLEVEHLTCPPDSESDSDNRHSGQGVGVGLDGAAAGDGGKVVVEVVVEVVLAFPLTRDPATGRPSHDRATAEAIAAAEYAGLAVLVHDGPARP